MGKDIVSFLSWAAEPEMEERKLVQNPPSLHNYMNRSDTHFVFACFDLGVEWKRQNLILGSKD